MTKLANPCTKTEIINRLATNESSNQIAKDYDVSGQRIRQIRKENQELIEQKAQELLKNLPNIVETAKHDIDISKRISKIIANCKDDELIDKLKEVKDILGFKQLTNKLSADILRAFGIFPAQSPSLVIQNIYGDDNSQNITISPSYQKFIDFQVGQRQIEGKDTQHIDAKEDTIDDSKPENVDNR